MTKELIDYSGKFNPSLTYKDFSKEQLLKLMDAWWKIGMQVDVWWNRIVSDNIGFEAAKKCNPLVWVLIAPHEIRCMREALNVTGDDVESFFKVIQNDIGFPQPLFDITWDLKNPKHGIITIHRCGGMDFYTRESQKRGYDMTQWLCHEYETAAFDAYTHAFNPNIQVKALKLPPKKTPSEPACQWEFTL